MIQFLNAAAGSAYYRRDADQLPADGSDYRLYDRSDLPAAEASGQEGRRYAQLH